MKPESRNPEREAQYWRSLEEYAETEEFQKLVQREYPSQAGALLDPLTRRRFLQLMGASLALAGLGACSRAPIETIVPYVRQPEEIVPGEPLYFATAMTLRGYALGLLVESHMGRPTKVEGNPLHPASLGASDAFAQASLLTLYDPDRSRTSTYIGRIRPWSAFFNAVRQALERDPQTGSRPANPYRHRYLTVPGSAAAWTCCRNTQARSWHQFEPAGGAPHSRRRASGVRRLCSDRSIAWIRPLSFSPSMATRIGWQLRQPALCPRLRAKTQHLQRWRRDEPALCGRKHAFDHRSHGGPSTCAGAAPNRAVCARPCRRPRHWHGCAPARKRSNDGSAP